MQPNVSYQIIHTKKCEELVFSAMFFKFLIKIVNLTKSFLS